MRSWPARAWRAYVEDSAVMATVGLAATGALTTALGLVGFWAPLVADVQTWWHLGPLALACAGSLVRRNRPEVTVAVAAVAAAADGLLGGSLMAVLVVIDALYTSERFGTPALRRTTHVAAGVVAVASVAAAWSAGLGLQGVLSTAFQVVGVLLVPFAWAAAVRSGQERAVAAEELRTAESERATAIARAAAAEREGAVRQERTRMAQELHDAVAGDLSAVVIQASATLALPRDGDRDADALRTVRTTGLHALAELRTMIDVLRLPEDPAIPAGSRLTRDLDALTHGLVAVELTGDDPAALPLADDVDHAAHRILQEALTNVGRHARSPRALVHLQHDADHLTLRVASALPAPARPTGGTGLGLPGMTERARSVGGTCEAGPHHGEWIVHARLPLRRSTS